MSGFQPIFCSMATLYLAGGLAYGGYLATDRVVLLRLGKGLWVIGFLFHSLFLVLSLFQSGRLPTAGLFEAFVFFAWAVVLAAYLSAFRYRIQILGAFILPLVFFLILVASVSLKQGVWETGAFSSIYFSLHTVFLFLGYAAFSLSFVAGMMYLILERQIKQKRLGRLYRYLPSLELLESANGSFLIVGFILYTFGIGFGLLWSRDALGTFFRGDPKVLLALFAWILYGSLFLGQRIGRLYGRRVMQLSVVYFLLVIASFALVQHQNVLTVLGSS